jgi:hypothetical protein
MLIGEHSNGSWALYLGTSKNVYTRLREHPCIIEGLRCGAGMQLENLYTAIESCLSRAGKYFTDVWHCSQIRITSSSDICWKQRCASYLDHSKSLTQTRVHRHLLVLSLILTVDFPGGLALLPHQIIQCLLLVLKPLMFRMMQSFRASEQ